MTKDKLMQLADDYAVAFERGDFDVYSQARQALSDAIDAALAKARRDALEEVESLAYSYASSLEWNDDFQEKLRALKEKTNG